MGAHGMINYVDARTSWMDGVVAAAVVIIAAGYCTRAYRLHQPGVKVGPGPETPRPVPQQDVSTSSSPSSSSPQHPQGTSCIIVGPREDATVRSASDSWMPRACAGHVPCALCMC